ncbi:MAG: ATP-binding cassette domain-containing protein [Mycoplasmatota bacterium]
MYEIEISNLKFKYEKYIFDNLSLNIKKGKWTTIVGSNGSGKSTLARILVGLLETEEGIIKVNKYILDKSTKKQIRGMIGFVFNNPDDQFVSDTVIEELTFSLRNQNFDEEYIKSQLDIMAKEFKLEELLYKSPHQLSGGEKQRVAIASNLIFNPQILILDEAFAMIDPIEKEKLVNLLKVFQKIKKTTIINITHDTEEILLSDYVVILDKGEILYNGILKQIYKEEKKLKKVGIELPFVVSLSKKLQYYELINKIYYKENELIGEIWK